MSAHHEMNSGAFDRIGYHYHPPDFARFLSGLYEFWMYTWNYRNEMTGFSEKNSTGTVIASGTYTYDSLDRRIGVDETSGGKTTQTLIVYNGSTNTPYAEFNGSGTLLDRYLAGPSYVPGVTGMIARTNASGVTDWYLKGKLGSVRDIVDTSGTVIDHISYGAFGSIRAETNPSSGSQFKFDGMQYDTVTGMYNDWHRNYDSTFGRFITEVPSGFLGTDFNLYRFIFNAPAETIDATGEEAVGHHWIPYSVLIKHYEEGFVKTNEVLIGLGSYTGPYLPEYGYHNGSSLGGNSATKYNNIILRYLMIYASKVRNTLSARDFLAILNKLSVRPRGSIGRYNQVIRAYSGWNRIEGYYTSRMAKNFAQAGGQYLFSNMRTFGARKLAIATGKKTLSVIIKKVPIVTAGFFLYYWYTGGFTYALGASFNDLTFPIGLAWQSKNFD